MTDVAHGEKPLPLLPGAHRVIRALDASEGPFVGLLVTRGDGVAVQLDAADLAGWVGWGFAGAEHVAGPLDLIRTAEGHDVLLPWCTERVAGLVARRHVADAALSLGECSTLVASMLRGIDELGEKATVERGGWWVTGEGRPVFATGEGTDACSGASRVLELLEEGCRDKAMGRLLATVQVGLRTAGSRPRIPRRQIEAWESELFELATPRPLRYDVHAPERAREVARAAPSRVSAVASRPRVRDRRSSKGIVSPWAQRVLSGLTDAMRAAVEGLQRSPSTGERRDEKPAQDSRVVAPPRSRRRSLVIAGVAAVAVLTGGLLWPSGESGEAAEEGKTQSPAGADASEMPSSVPIASGVATPGAESGEVPSTNDESPSSREERDPLAAVPALLGAVLACVEAGDQQCDDALIAGSADAISTLAEIADAEPIPQLVDEYGDVAVVRVNRATAVPDENSGEIAGEPAGHILVLVRTNEKWLVRDVYDVADQPE